jgi:hypothetical protein
VERHIIVVDGDAGAVLDAVEAFDASGDRVASRITLARLASGLIRWRFLLAVKRTLERRTS